MPDAPGCGESAPTYTIGADRATEPIEHKKMALETLDVTDTAVIVERVGNGYQVRPLYGPEGVVTLREILVFQEKGRVSSAHYHLELEANLLGWLDKHFTEVKPNI